MNTSIEIMIDDQNVELSRKGAVLGNVWVKLGEFAFPSDDWSDFVVVILTWWLNTIPALRQHNSASIHELQFMDGPYYIQMTTDDQEIVWIVCKERIVNGYRVIYECHCLNEEICKAIISAARTVLNIAKTRDWVTPETQKLMKALECIS
jgi:hypothetical protein